MRVLRSFPTLLLILLLGGCADNAINAVFTFTKSGEFELVIPPGAPQDQPQAFSFMTDLGFAAAAEKNGTTTALIRSAKLTRMEVTSLDSTLPLGLLRAASFTLSSSDRAEVVGNYELIPDTTGLAMYLPLSDSDLTFLFKDSSASASFSAVPRTLVASARPIKVGYTISVTALPR